MDLLTQANVRLDGAAGTFSAGESVAAAGDVNGDGIGDVIVGAATTAGTAYRATIVATDPSHNIGRRRTATFIVRR